MITESACFTYPVSDMARARQFYEDVLGLRLETDFRGEWLEYGIGSGTFAITTMDLQHKPGVKGGIIAFEVDDLDQTLAHLKNHLVPFVVEVCETEVCRLAVVSDPDGNDIVIHKRKPAHA